MSENFMINRLNKYVGLFNPSDPTITDDYGEPTDESVNVCHIWASIEPLRGQDRYAAKQEHAEVTTRIRIRYRAEVDRSMIVKYGEQEFEILYIIHPNYAKKELQLMCKERQ